VGALLERIPTPRQLIADRAYDARKLTYHYKGLDQLTSATWIIYTGPKYKVNGYNPDGFEIRASYDTSVQRQNADAIVGSLKWK